MVLLAVVPPLEHAICQIGANVCIHAPVRLLPNALQFATMFQSAQHAPSTAKSHSLHPHAGPLHHCCWF